MKPSEKGDPMIRRTEVVFLRDDPVHSDSFGPHLELARALASTVRCQKGGRAIALEGAWGSGKSSIVEMMRRELESSKDSDTAVFIFDAWSHRGDPLRRAFVTGLFQFLRSRGFIGEDAGKTLADSIAELGSTRTESVERNDAGTIIDRVVRGLAATLLLVLPIGLAVVGSGLEDWMKVGIWLAGAPLGFWALLWILFIMGRGSSVLARGLPSWKFFDRFAALMHDTPTRRIWPSAGGLEPRKFEVQSTRDRTSIEFREAFDAVAQVALRDHTRRLVVVIDNLDRLDLADALDVWATMRLFTDTRRAENGIQETIDWRQQTWLLVPYDPTGLKALFATSPSKVAAEGVSTTERAGSSFIDKAFQIRFEAPPLLLTRWRPHLSRLVKEAMPFFSRDSAELHRLYRVMSIAYAAEGRPPTPRQILLFVNDIAAIVRSRGDEDVVPLSHIAYYLFLKGREGGAEGVRSALLAERVYFAQFAAVLPNEEAMLDVAKVLFGTRDSLEAAELLLKGQLVQALGNPDGVMLRKLSEGPAFWPAFELIAGDVVSSMPSDSSAARLALSSLEASGLLESSYESATDTVRRIAKALLGKGLRPSLSQEDGDGLAAGIRLVKDEATTVLCLKDVNALTLPGLKPSDYVENPPDWAIAHAHAIVSVDAAIRQVHQVDAPFALRGEAEQAVAVLGAMGIMVGSGRLPQLDLTSVAGDVFAALSMKPLIWPPQWRFAAIVVAQRAGLKEGWNPVAKAIAAMLGGHDIESPEIAPPVADATAALLRGDYSSGIELVSWLVDSGSALSVVGLLSRAGQNIQAARWVGLIMMVRDPGAVPTSKDSGADGAKYIQRLRESPDRYPSEVNEVATMLAELGRGDVGRLLLDSQPSRTWSAQLLGLWTAQGAVSRLFEPKLLFSRWSEIEAICDASPKEIVDKRSVIRCVFNDPAFRARLDKETLERKAPVLAALGADEILREEGIGEVARQSLAKLNADQWIQYLVPPSPVVRLAVSLHLANDATAQGIPAKEALKRLMDRVVAGEMIWQPSEWPRVRAFVGSLDPTRLEVLGRDVIDQLEVADDSRFAVLKDIFGPAIEAALRKIDSGRFLRNTAAHMISRGTRDDIVWLAGVLEQHPRLVSEASHSEKRDLADHLRLLRDRGAAEESKTAINDLLRTLEPGTVE